MKWKNSPAFVASLIGLQALVACSGPGSIQSTIAAFEAKDCAPVIEAEMKSLGINEGMVTKIDYVDKFFSFSEDNEFYEYEAWIQFSSCPGTLVIVMDNACYINRIYSSRGCTKHGTPTEG